MSHLQCGSADPSTSSSCCCHDPSTSSSCCCHARGAVHLRQHGHLLLLVVLVVVLVLVVPLLQQARPGLLMLQ
jgi:hypothetical protein